MLKPREIVDYIRSIGDVRLDYELQLIESLEPEPYWSVSFGVDKLYFKDLDTLGVLYTAFHRRYTADNMRSNVIMKFRVNPAPDPLLEYVNK